MNPQDLQTAYGRGYNAVKSFGNLNPVAPAGTPAPLAAAYVQGINDANNKVAFNSTYGVQQTMPPGRQRGYYQGGDQQGDLSSYLPYLEGGAIGYVAGQQGWLNGVFGGQQQTAMTPPVQQAPQIIQVPGPTPPMSTWTWVLGGLVAVAVVGGGALLLAKK